MVFCVSLYSKYNLIFDNFINETPKQDLVLILATKKSEVS
uniref:Uncharacterized protein n=1 Tax=Anguilla anguilla TaxID=7936 RepID=A0A0E9RH23_ANGAN